MSEARPPSPEDDDATAEEWRAPSHYRFSILVSPARAQNVLTLLSLKRSAFKWPGAMLGVAALFLFIAAAQVDGNTLREPFTIVAAVIIAIALGLLALDFSPALLALRGEGRLINACIMHMHQCGRDALRLRPVLREVLGPVRDRGALRRRL